MYRQWQKAAHVIRPQGRRYTFSGARELGLLCHFPSNNQPYFVTARNCDAILKPRSQQ
jgi:hypothetical protein